MLVDNIREEETAGSGIRGREWGVENEGSRKNSREWSAAQWEMAVWEEESDALMSSEKLELFAYIPTTFAWRDRASLGVHGLQWCRFITIMILRMHTWSKAVLNCKDCEWRATIVHTCTRYMAHDDDGRSWHAVPRSPLPPPLKPVVFKCVEVGAWTVVRGERIVQPFPTSKSQKEIRIVPLFPTTKSQKEKKSSHRSLLASHRRRKNRPIDPYQ